ncbi:cytochrome bd oxidase small subunit CydS [Salisediminibacterium halotolerans]|uniref:Tumour necrosis factor receptor superfamily member 19 n=1 Tax=Salisediminibacterium halotolerans TaxID=517425 RepID=A0A1H9TIB0_9BACI|nr:MULTISPECIES: hypothetical protein [Salisediminibacterium]RLJ72374.1 hypothetical protein BCL39_2276 [Actinophytocola xinjiangensis]RPE85589.1 hypothetical protein EDD67_2410 [Salisediminibacterium halotolerans]TWG33543.1 hypothetical protein BCL52_2271 [Salisediminibacterium halotolerans]SER96935.1 hypothetical protein SAMN05444126_11036 [Salisediminibacterium haloalkalitolerans]GEL08742.1 hypothetical protein SHA02_21580 [Salisediminibacterium halotolerans]
MDLTYFLIMIAPVLILFLSIAIVFFWAGKAKPPSFLREADPDEEPPSDENI